MQSVIQVLMVGGDPRVVVKWTGFVLLQAPWIKGSLRWGGGGMDWGRPPLRIRQVCPTLRWGGWGEWVDQGYSDLRKGDPRVVWFDHLFCFLDICEGWCCSSKWGCSYTSFEAILDCSDAYSRV